MLIHKYRIYFYMSRPFMTQNSAQKINLVKSIWETEFVKPVQIVLEFCQFSAQFLCPQKSFKIINFEWLNTKLLDLISVVSSDCRADIFSYVYISEAGIKLLLLLLGKG